MAKPCALLVEDSPEYELVGRRLLEEEGFEVAVAHDGETAVAMARSQEPELILLDISLPLMDGIEVCRQIREFTDAYVIMLTGRTEELDRVIGLAVGADDYVTKPFSARELALRIRAMRRRPRAQAATTKILNFGPLSIDIDARQVQLADTPVELTRIEFDLLTTLCTQPRRTYTRQQLLEAVWGNEWFGDDHLVDVHMANLRKKIGETGSDPKHLHTVRGVGYRFDP
ncbi:MAG: winged helix-turn-helix domain-containing protein [Mycobacteriaceae bacterium]